MYMYICAVRVEYTRERTLLDVSGPTKFSLFESCSRFLVKPGPRFYKVSEVRIAACVHWITVSASSYASSARIVEVHVAVEALPCVVGREVIHQLPVHAVPRRTPPIGEPPQASSHMRGGDRRLERRLTGEIAAADNPRIGSARTGVASLTYHWKMCTLCQYVAHSRAVAVINRPAMPPRNIAWLTRRSAAPYESERKSR